jgi:hypothetical protein
MDETTREVVQSELSKAIGRAEMARHDLARREPEAADVQVGLAIEHLHELEALLDVRWRSE